MRIFVKCTKIPTLFHIKSTIQENLFLNRGLLCAAFQLSSFIAIPINAKNCSRCKGNLDCFVFLLQINIEILVHIVELLFYRLFMICNLCPRMCGAERTVEKAGGVCRSPSIPAAAKAMLHQWEEPCLTGTHGAGTVFFSGCSLRCVYCQNHAITKGGVGQKLTAERLRAVYQHLIDQGAECIELVTPSHFTPWILESLSPPLAVPVVWNSSGYEKPDTLRLLEGRVQIYLPDLKYALPEPAKAYSAAPDYFAWATAAIQEMYRQTGPYRFQNGLLLSGVLIRHLVLPGEMENTRRVIDWVSRTFHQGEVLFSLMSQYTPQPNAVGKLRRRVTGAEYRAAVAYMENCGIQDGYVQERSSAKALYTPDFDTANL